MSLTTVFFPLGQLQAVAALLLGKRSVIVTGFSSFCVMKIIISLADII